MNWTEKQCSVSSGESNEQPVGTRAIPPTPVISRPSFSPSGFFLAWAAAWTVSLLTVAIVGFCYLRADNLSLALAAARVALQKDVLYRTWNSERGGVYVPVTDKTPPNLYLAAITNRDVATTDGQKLTLVNPAYMTRMVHELQAQEYGVKGHITSLKPIRPENAPDAWEADALKRLESGGAEEVTAVTAIDGGRYVRLMRPLATQKACLRCHAQQGYREGDLRGGISVSVPVNSLWATTDTRAAHVSALALVCLWFFGVGGIYTTARIREQRLQERARAVREILELARFPGENPSPIFRIARDGTLMYANPPGQTLLESLHTGVNQLAPEAWRAWTIESLGLGKMMDHEATIQGRVFSLHVTPIGEGAYVNLYGRDITARKQADAEREKLIGELQTSLREVKTLSGLLPICARCKKIRNDQGYWDRIEAYITEHTTARFSHGLCPDCFEQDMAKLRGGDASANSPQA